MIISRLINRQHAFRTPQLHYLGFPTGSNSMFDWINWEVDSEEVSRHTTVRFSALSREVPSFNELMLPQENKSFFQNLGALIVIAMTVFFIIGIGSQTNLNFGNTVLVIFITNWILWELWSFHNCSKLRQFNRLKKAEFTVACQKIIDDELADRELCQMTEGHVEDFKLSLATNGGEADNRDLIRPADTRREWRVASAHFHSIDADPSERDATIVLNNGTESVVCTVASRMTIHKWLDKELSEMRSNTVAHTHTHEYLKTINADSILVALPKLRDATMQKIGEIATAVSLPIEERPAVSIYGERRPGGEVMLHAFGIADEDGVPALAHTDSQPITMLRRSVEQYLSDQGAHPAITAI